MRQGWRYVLRYVVRSNCLNPKISEKRGFFYCLIQKEIKGIPVIFKLVRCGQDTSVIWHQLALYLQPRRSELSFSSDLATSSFLKPSVRFFNHQEFTWTKQTASTLWWSRNHRRIPASFHSHPPSSAVIIYNNFISFIHISEKNIQNHHSFGWNMFNPPTSLTYRF